MVLKPLIWCRTCLCTVIGYSYHRWPAVMEFSFLAACRCVKLLLYWLWLIWQINFSLSLPWFCRFDHFCRDFLLYIGITTTELTKELWDHWYDERLKLVNNNNDDDVTLPPAAPTATSPHHVNDATEVKRRPSLPLPSGLTSYRGAFTDLTRVGL